MTTILIVLAFGGSFAPLLHLFWRRGQTDDPQSDPDEGGGGNQRREPPRPQDSGGGEPAWWPQFERDFADYACNRDAVRSGRR